MMIRFTPLHAVCVAAVLGCAAVPAVAQTGGLGPLIPAPGPAPSGQDATPREPVSLRGGSPDAPSAPAAAPSPSETTPREAGRPGAAAPGRQTGGTFIMTMERAREAMAAYDRHDYATAIRIWREEAERGDSLAMWAMGEMLQYGTGIQRDLNEAVRYFRRSAELNDPMGQFLLGYMYEQGRGVPRNLAEARRLYELSAAQGNPGAIESLRTLGVDAGEGGPRPGQRPRARPQR
jgi:TPR repeat protein